MNSVPILIPNCSESCFRFWTVDPKEIQQILQALADEINSNTDFTPHSGQKVPLLDDAEKYDTKWNGELTYSGKTKEQYQEEINKIWGKRDKGMISQEEADKLIDTIDEKINKIVYPNSLLKCCAGLGDNDCVVSVNKKKGYFDLNIGNNDISQDNTGWTDTVQMICKCEEAEGNTESSKELAKKARDCTCGISYF